MALSYALRQALKNRTRRWRRVEVAMFFFWLLLGLVEGAGRPLSWGTVGIRSFPYIWAIGQIFGYWRRMRTLPVTSLDDRAMVEYGVEFEQLGEAEQKDLLRRYQVGTYMVNNFPDEREGAQEQGSQMRAYAMLRWLLPMLAAVYAVGWWVLPEGRVRNGWTNGPVVVTWLFLLVLALPQMIRMWTEPDEVGEPRVVVMEREA
jgi:hypothetical protein